MKESVNIAYTFARKFMSTRSGPQGTPSCLSSELDHPPPDSLRTISSSDLIFIFTFLMAQWRKTVPLLVLPWQLL
jgi:hypothetical protein